MSRSRAPLFVVAAALCVALGAAVLAACGGAGGGATASPSSVSDPVVLRVDGLPVHRSAIDAVRAEFRLGGTSDAEARAEKEAVRRELVRREAARLGLKVDAAAVAARRAALVDKAGGQDAFTVALQRFSMTEAQLRRGLEDGVLHDALQDAKFGALRATRRQARAYYDAHGRLFHQVASVHLWSIQVRAERIAQSALARLRSGHPFEEVARQFSNDLEAKAKGGDLGRVALASLPGPFRKAIAATPAGRVSKAVAGPGGWFLLLATGRRPAGTTPFAEVEQQLVRELTRRQRFAALEAWLKAARDKATVTRP
jgi:parvulin-like peptidyl-prolyl isomerase